MILNIIFIGGWFIVFGSVFYYVSKFVFEGFIENVRKELRFEWNVKMGVVEMKGIYFLEFLFDGFGGSLVY